MAQVSPLVGQAVSKPATSTPANRSLSGWGGAFTSPTGSIGMNPPAGMTNSLWTQYGSALARYPQFPAMNQLATQLNAPQMGQIDLASQAAQNQFTLGQAGSALNRTELQTDFTDRMARLGLGQQGLGLDRARLGIDNDYWNKMLGFADRGFGIDMNKAGAVKDIANRQQKSDATARGAMVSEGNRFALSAIARQYGIDTDTAVLGRDTAKARPETELARNVVAGKELDLKAKEYGLDAQSFQNQLNIGLQKIGLNDANLLNQLNEALASNDLQKQMAANNIIQQALMWAMGAATVTPTAPSAAPEPTRSIAPGAGAVAGPSGPVESGGATVGFHPNLNTGTLDKYSWTG
jgi:hypothetical protein